MRPSGRQLAGRSALVTGSSRGIGLAVARRLGSLGARIVLCARHAGPLDEARRLLAGEGVDAVAIRADLTRAAAVKRLVAAAHRKMGEIDILVNSAGVGWFGPVHKAGERDWNRVLDTNLKAAFLMIRAVAAGMIRRGRGDIVNIASLAGKNAFAGGAVYCASKWGLLGLSYAAAEDLRTHGIRVSVICPGTVETAFSPHHGKDPGKMLQPDDVARAVEMILLAERRSFISELLLRPTQKP